MNKEVLFAKTLEQVRKTAKEQGNCISEEQVKEAFAELDLSNEQLQMVFDYLLKHKIGIGQPMDPDEFLTEEEKDYLQEYLDEVKARIDTFLVHHPYLDRADVPAEMVTASASGLDPDITPQCAYVQVKRVAQARGLTEEQVRAIVDKSIEKPFLGLLGTEKVNVLKLNIALEESNK